jgi:voltage-dependent potassium channel beta subunit
MEYRRLGKSGLKVSALSFGSWVTFHKQIGDDVATSCMKRCYDHGVNFFDNAESYASGESERMMGRILKQMGWSRDTWLVSSKVFWGGKKPNQTGLSKKHVFEACHAALERLQVDYLDLYFCHRPDPETPIFETVWAMHQLVMQGKILYWGTSEWSAVQIEEAHQVASQHHLVAPVMEQPQYNMFHRHRVELEYKPLYEKYGLGTTIWSPLASGILTGKYNDKFVGGTRLSLEGMEWLKDSALTEERVAKVKSLAVIANELNTSLPELALAWCMKNPQVSTVIMGASTENQVSQNLGALHIVEKLTPDVMEKIENILHNKPQVEFLA